MNTKLEDRVIGLAGMLQALELVNQIATQGEADAFFFSPTIHSLLQMDAPSAEAVYGGLSGVRLGLESILRVLGPDRGQYRSQLQRYGFGILLLERRLHRHPEMLHTVRLGLERSLRQAEHFEVTHPMVIANLASVYTDTLSTMRFRIYVRGEQRFLSEQANIDKVRALLLAAIRGAVLWRQKGGRNFHLLFMRTNLVKASHSMLQHLG